MWYSISRLARAGSSNTVSVKSAADSAAAIGSKVSPVCDGNDSRVRGYPGGTGGKIASNDSGSVSVSGYSVFSTAVSAFFCSAGIDNLTDSASPSPRSLYR